jgi:hypothetical protein
MVSINLKLDMRRLQLSQVVGVAMYVIYCLKSLDNSNARLVESCLELITGVSRTVEGMPQTYCVFFFFNFFTRRFQH